MAWYVAVVGSGRLVLCFFLDDGWWVLFSRLLVAELWVDGLLGGSCLAVICLGNVVVSVLVCGWVSRQIVALGGLVGWWVGGWAGWAGLVRPGLEKFTYYTSQTRRSRFFSGLLDSQEKTSVLSSILELPPSDKMPSSAQRSDGTIL